MLIVNFFSEQKNIGCALFNSDISPLTIVFNVSKYNRYAGEMESTGYLIFKASDLEDDSHCT